MAYNKKRTGGKKDCYFTKYPGDCKRFISEEILKNESSHFIVYGGDGTINEAICALADSPAKDSACLTFIPAGSGNDFAKSLKIPTSPELALERILNNTQNTPIN